MDPNTPTSQPSELDSITKPAAPAAVPLRPKRWRVIAAGSVVGLSLLGVAVYSAVRFFGVADAPVAQPVSQPGLSEAEQAVVGQPKPLNSTILDVTRVVAQAAELGALQVDSLVVTGSATFDQTLGVQGAGTFGGTVTATGFAGDGRNVTNVDAVLLNGRPGSYYANLANLQGSLGEGQLPANVALRSAPNTFSASNTFSGGVVVSGSAALTGSTTISSLVLGAPLAVSSGGTGLSTIPVNGVVYGQGAVGMGVAVPSAAGQCLVSTSTDVQFGSCLGGAAVSSLNGLTGALTIANASGSGTVVTLNDASTAAKGIASFDATNFSVSGGVVNTVQNLAVTSAPTFAGLTLSGALTVANGGTGAVTAVGARGNLGAAASGANTDITSLGGLTTALSVAQGGTGATSLTANAVLVGNGTSAVTAVSGTNGECLVIVGGAPSFQSCLSTGVTSLNGQTGALTLAGNDPASVTTSGGAITLNDASTSLRGLASFNATNFTVTNGAVNTVQNIDATAAPTFGQLSLTGVGGLTLGVSGGSGTAGVVTFYDGSTAFGASINTLSLTANRIVRLPDESGVICLQTSTNCGFLASSAGSGFVQLQGVTPGSVQTGNLNISGTAIAATFKADDFDRATAGTLTVGNTNATVINLGTTAAGRTVNVGTGAAAQTVNIGSTNGASATTVSAGTGGLGFYTPANSSVSFVNNGVTAFNLDLLGRASFRPNADDTGIFNLQNAAGTTMFHADSTNNVIGTVGFTRLRSGYGGVNTDGAISIDPGVFGSYTTPLGTVLATKFSIANDDPGSFGSLIWAGLPSTANSNSRVLAVTDARTGTHEPTIAVVSPDEVRVGGFSWDGSNSTFAVKTSADGLAFKNSSGTALNLVQAAGYQIAALGGGGYNGALQLNNSTNTNSVSLTATSGVGNYVIDLPPALGVAGQCLSVASVSGNVQTLGYGACAGGSGVTLQASTPGSPDTGNFNISGTGIAGALQAPDFDRQAAGTLTFGSTNATAVEIGRIGTTTYIQGTLNTEYVQTSLLDRAVSGTLDIGTANATTINIGHAGVTTYFQDKINAEYVQTTDIDRAVPGNLALGSTNATSISLGQSTTLAAGKSLTVTGGDTGSRPASPTEGMIYFDTDTKKLLTYSNGKWQADRTTAVIVAASTSSQSDKDAADFVATGTNDQTTITNAIGSLPGTSGGTVYLMDGIYYFGASLTVSRPLMALVGGPTRAAVIYRMFNGSSLANGSLIKLDTISPTIKNLYLHGNSATYTNTFNNGIYSTVNTGNVKIESSVFSRSAGSSVYMDGDINRYNAGSIVRDNDFGYSGQNAVYMNFGDRNQVLDNRVYISSDVGINAVQSNNTLIANNTVTQATNTGIHLGEGSGNAVTGNTVSNSNQGFSGGSWGLTVTGNSLSGNADTGLELGGFVSGLAVSGNNISGNGDGIRILPGVQQLVINGNKINFNAGYGIGADVATAVRNVAISGNVISENDEEGILLVNQVYDTSISDNNFMDNGGTGAFSSIVNNGASGNSITGNTIRDSAGTGYAIEIGGGAGNTYLANNTFSGVGSASILDLSLSTVYDGQMTSAADGFVFRGSSDSSAAFQIQNSSGDTLLNVDTSSGNIRLSAAFQVQTAAGVNVLAADNATGVVTLGEASSLNGQLSLANATNANTATLASGVTTASYTTVLPTGIGVAGQCLNVASVSGSTQTLGYGACGTSTGVTLQAGTPGTPDTGNLNISGTGIFGTAVSTAQLVAGGQSILGGDNDQVQLVVKADAGQSPNNPR